MYRNVTAEMIMADAEKKTAAVYVSWKTFQNSIEALAKGEIPNVIDKSVFTGMAFSVQNQLFTGMRFLGLIDDNNKPLPDLAELADPVEERRKEKLREILQRRYADLFALNLKKGTPTEVEKKMGESYAMAGDTKEKAVRFFISAAEYVGVELSPLLSSPKKGNSGATRTTVRKRVPRKDPATPSNPADTRPAGTSKTVRLQSGGELTLFATLDLFSLNTEDRKFVFDLIDKLEGYKQPAVEPAIGAEAKAT
jgi:hypothetical protein